VLLQVLQYYYRGVASWDWFYPYHYAPMAQDMRRLDNIDGEQPL
jgi:5'-3' exonuclease